MKRPGENAPEIEPQQNEESLPPLRDETVLNIIERHGGYVADVIEKVAGFKETPWIFAASVGAGIIEYGLKHETEALDVWLMIDAQQSLIRNFIRSGINEMTMPPVIYKYMVEMATPDTPIEVIVTTAAITTAVCAGVAAYKVGKHLYQEMKSYNSEDKHLEETHE